LVSSKGYEGHPNNNSNIGSNGNECSASASTPAAMQRQCYVARHSRTCSERSGWHVSERAHSVMCPWVRSVYMNCFRVCMCVCVLCSTRVCVGCLLCMCVCECVCL
jgi:hypothetical protein